MSPPTACIRVAWRQASGQNRPGVLKLILRLARPFLITPEQGAATSIHLRVVSGSRGRQRTILYELQTGPLVRRQPR